MPPIKRKSGSSYSARYKRARTQGRAFRGTMNLLTRAYNKRAMARPVVLTRTINRVNNLYRMIETKEITWKLESTALSKNYMSHNQVTLWSQNPLQVSQGAADSMAEGNQANRIGDQITIKGMMVKGFFENALSRPKVFYRVMLIRAAKGDTISRDTLFKGNCSNKMMDQVNTERFTIVAQKTFNIQPSNNMTTSADLAGNPSENNDRAGIATKTFQMWIPGAKFGKGGNVQFENNSYQVKFYDYRFVFLAYDWLGTPQDTNNIGLVNCFYTKTYFKDA